MVKVLLCCDVLLWCSTASRSIRRGLVHVLWLGAGGWFGIVAAVAPSAAAETRAVTVLSTQQSAPHTARRQHVREQRHSRRRRAARRDGQADEFTGAQ
jgi:hypothetical protein